MATEGAEIVPLDIKAVRQGLGISRELLAKVLSQHVIRFGKPGPVGSRINEWENHVRSTPAYIYSATAQLLLDIWTECRAKVDSRDRLRVDYKFAQLLSPTYAEVLNLEQCCQATGKKMAGQVSVVRKQLESDLGILLNVDISAVFTGQGC